MSGGLSAAHCVHGHYRGQGCTDCSRPVTATSPAYPKGTDIVVVKVSLSRADYESFQRLGNGYATHGIRAALAVQDNAWSRK